MRIGACERKGRLGGGEDAVLQGVPGAHREGGEAALRGFLAQPCAVEPVLVYMARVGAADIARSGVLVDHGLLGFIEEDGAYPASFGTLAHGRALEEGGQDGVAFEDCRVAL